jgi:hypothetical protein
MSKTASVLIIKYIITFIAVWIAFDYIERNTLGTLLFVALACTVINYLVGDLLVLPNLGNIVASIGDGLLGALVAYGLDLILVGFITTINALIIFGILIAIVEFFFHIYLTKRERVAP